MTALHERLQAALAERYRIERELGAGGMATVFLAHDPRHDRKVAIKLFRPELCAILGAERFLTEITVTGNLQHPHILPLYDSGSADGLLYYVMPFVEGESLRQRLDRERQLPVSEAVRIAREVADALDYAHRHGVIHRDVKPENILLHDGRALVADFGIALAVQKAGGARLTETGLSLGTPQYMSPEQATAERDVDARSDVYSLGCVLYEMLAGEPPHSGPTTQAVIAKIITDRPRPIAELRETVPPPVAAALHTALAKLAADRFPTAAGFAEALGRPDTVAMTSAWSSPAGRKGAQGAIAGVAAVTGVLALAAGWLLGRGGAERDRAEFPPSRLSILSTTVGGSGGAIQGRQVAITPDGAAVLYAAVAEGVGNRVVIQRLDAEEPAPVPGGEGLFTAFVFPDGRSVFASSMILGRTLSLAGGTPGPSPVPPGVAFAAWHPDGSFWFSRSPYGSMERIPRGGDAPETMLRDLPGLRLQQILDDGRTALVVRAPSRDRQRALRVAGPRDGHVVPPARCSGRRGEVRGGLPGLRSRRR
jgi:eukaryotic-like serine/threonine-protein kinase